MELAVLLRPGIWTIAGIDAGRRDGSRNRWMASRQPDCRTDQDDDEQQFMSRHTFPLRRLIATSLIINTLLEATVHWPTDIRPVPELREVCS